MGNSLYITPSYFPPEMTNKLIHLWQGHVPYQFFRNNCYTGQGLLLLCRRLGVLISFMPNLPNHKFRVNWLPDPIQIHHSIGQSFPQTGKDLQTRVSSVDELELRIWFFGSDGVRSIPLVGISVYYYFFFSGSCSRLCTEESSVGIRSKWPPPGPIYSRQ